jgi:hypothetical protein
MQLLHDHVQLRVSMLVTLDLWLFLLESELVS